MLRPHAANFEFVVDCLWQLLNTTHISPSPCSAAMRVLGLQFWQAASVFFLGNADGPLVRSTTTTTVLPGIAVVVFGAGSSEANGVYDQSTPCSSHTWVDRSFDYYAMRYEAPCTQQGLVDLYWNAGTNGWKISVDGHERYHSTSLLSGWSTYNTGLSPAPTVRNIQCRSSDAVAVSGAGVFNANGVYCRSTMPASLASRADPNRGYYMLVLQPESYNPADVLIDLYFALGEAGDRWVIAVDGVQLYFAPDGFCGQWLTHDALNAPGPTVSGNPSLETCASSAPTSSDAISHSSPVPGACAALLLALTTFGNLLR